MDDSFLKKYARTPAEPGPGNVVDFEASEDLGPFGWLRGVRDRCPMIEFRKKSGNILVLGYAWLHRIDFDPSEGITLWFASQKVVIRGQNLNAEVRPNVRLLDGLVRHRVPWISEANRSSAVADHTPCMIEAVRWEG